METEVELQSGYLTGTKPRAARNQREGGRIQSIQTLPTIHSLVCVCVCVSVNWIRNTSYKAAVHPEHQHSTEYLHLV